MITGASATSRIRIIPEQANAIALTAKRAALSPAKQPMSLQLTSGSGEQTKNEAALWLNQEVENLTLLSYSYCITGTSKPADT